MEYLTKSSKEITFLISNPSSQEDYLSASQYTIDSRFHDDFSAIGFLSSTLVGFFFGFLGDGGMQYNYYDKLDAVGKRAYNAISLAYNKYGCSKGFVSTLNLWGSKLAKSLSKSFSLNFENAFIVNSFSNICTMYSTSIEWVFGKNN